MNSKSKCLLLLGAATLPFLAYSQQPQSLPTDSLTHLLEEVVVTARQPATRLEGSTLVSTIAGTPLQNIGNALDLLAQLPMIKVQDTAVSVIGRDNIEIYIDGRPLRDDSELRQLLSSNIRKVELLMAPGAMYAATTGAVLKITTRRNFIRGLSLTDQLQLKRQRRWSAVNFLSLNYRLSDWDIFASASLNHNNTLNKGYTLNSLDYEGKPCTLGSSQHNLNKARASTIKAGLNYAKDKLSFGAYYRFNPEKGDFTNKGAEWLDQEPPLDRDIHRDIRGRSHLISAYYDNTFNDSYHLHFDGDFRHSSADNAVSTLYPSDPTADVNSSDHKTNSLWAGKLYLSFPLANGDFTVGTQDSHTSATLDYRMLNDKVEGYIPSSLTETRQTSAALFASWSRLLGKLSLTLGARYEYVDFDYRLDGKRDKDLSRRDHTLTPDISLSYSFSERSQLSLSYKLSTVKPPYSQLTSSLNYVGRHEIEGGNPGLRDERMHGIQLFSMWNDFILQADLTRSLDTYAFVKELYPAPTMQLLLHPVNIDVSSLSLYLLWGRQIGRWNPNVTLGMYRQWLTMGQNRYDKPIFSFYFDNTLSLPHGWLLTANISGSTRGDMHTNRFAATRFTMDASVGRTFFNKSLTVKLSANDIFNTSNNDWSMNTNGIFVDKHQSYDHRGISLDLTYSFQPRRSKYKGSAASEAEMKRL